MVFFGLALTQLATGCATGQAAPLAAAAADDNVAEARRLLRAGHLVDDVGPDGLTPLIAATRRGAVNALRLLLAEGADPNLPDNRATGWPPVKHAVHSQQLAALRALLEAGADPDNRGRGGEIPLVMAAAEVDPGFVKALLAHGADPRADGNQGSQVMSKAVSGGALDDIERPLLGGCHPQTLRALVEHDPTLRLSPAYGPSRRARFIARYHGCREVLELIERAEQRAALKVPAPPTK
jgi:hypothetical protein